MPTLEPEQEQLFMRLVEAVRSTPREKRISFMMVRTMGGAVVQGNGFNERVLDEDVDVLADVGLIRVTDYGRGSTNFRIPPEAAAYYEELKARRGAPTQQIEQEILTYLDASSFQANYPQAYARWSEAASLLWHADSSSELSTIGHKCREAMQEFVTALIALHGAQDAPPDKALTRQRLRAVIAPRRPVIGEARYELLEELFDYWGAVGALIQRQEHAGQREGEPLVWEDGRRAVFQTAVVMFEIDRSL